MKNAIAKFKFKIAKFLKLVNKEIELFGQYPMLYTNKQCFKNVNIFSYSLLKNTIFFSYPVDNVKSIRHVIAAKGNNLAVVSKDFKSRAFDKMDIHAEFIHRFFFKIASNVLRYENTVFIDLVNNEVTPMDLESSNKSRVGIVKKLTNRLKVDMIINSATCKELTNLTMFFLINPDIKKDFLDRIGETNINKEIQFSKSDAENNLFLIISKKGIFNLKNIFSKIVVPQSINISEVRAMAFLPKKYTSKITRITKSNNHFNVHFVDFTLRVDENNKVIKFSSPKESDNSLIIEKIWYYYDARGYNIIEESPSEIREDQ